MTNRVPVILSAESPSPPENAVLAAPDRAYGICPADEEWSHGGRQFGGLPGGVLRSQSRSAAGCRTSHLQRRAARVTEARVTAASAAGSGLPGRL